MAMLNGSTAAAAANLIPRSRIEAVLSVSPLKVTDPRRSCQVSATDSGGSGIFWSCLHIIMYYEKASGEDSGWLVAGWMKESLGRALMEQPMLAGRLRRGGDDGGLEIVSNDSGVRLLEARIPKTLSEFLDLRKKKKEDAEAELVIWKDGDEQNPQFCPLFYVQVTNFECGGYSVGLSCSILLADTLVITSFLKRWANIHNNLVSKADMPKIPMFYAPHHKPNSCYPTNPFGSSKNHGQSMIFKIPNKSLMGNKTVALLCIEEAERKLGVEMASKFSLIVKESSENIKVEDCWKEEIVEKPSSFVNGLMSCASWDDLEASEVAFHEGNKPVHVSYWIYSVSGGLAMVIPSPDHDEAVSGVHIIVTIPNEKEI
uniref:Putative anthranilate N-benzoyltransferase protein 3 n=1 Tax=Davidia involucrata TaxID=16924 RepID=A0A5B7BXR7_DAVIN